MKLAGLMGARAIVSGSFLLLVLSLALVGGGLVSMDTVLHERLIVWLAPVWVCCCLGCRFAAVGLWFLPEVDDSWR